jgi:hypothetical protein
MTLRLVDSTAAHVGFQQSTRSRGYKLSRERILGLFGGVCVCWLSEVCPLPL